MAYQTGTATDHLNLLSKLNTFLAAQGWTVDHWNAAGELVAHGPGVSGTEEIFIGASVYEDVDGDAYGWTLQGFTGFFAGQGMNQPGAIPEAPPILPLTNGAMPYWFVVSGSRLIVVARVSSVYSVAYLGLPLTYGSPGQFPYPLVVGGTGTGRVSRRYSATGTDARAFFDPGLGAAANDFEDHRTSLRLLSGSWLGLRNRYGTSSETVARGLSTWPYCWPDLPQVVQGQDGTPVLTPIVLAATEPERRVWGELEGVYHVSGHGLSAEDVVTEGGVSHLVVPNLYRAGVADFCAVALS